MKSYCMTHVLQCACLRLFCPRPKIINRICRATRSVPGPTPHPNKSIQINSIMLNKFRILLEVRELSEGSRDPSSKGKVHGDIGGVIG